ncbi:toxin-antitoxin system YwqK family antitoxin [Aquimarina muelleri]|uniref:MORN repeat variant n=1 Tax=Aquimarina muelleri TaxID=279356 RepID=A0A918JWI8_9FLAO|nr:hypothetical protein [Aquimarina muelleri]MCX2762931.1 hypothetical protein [Aquimarina muelleri]GGX27311.1 hypothetical protein GCM10007384_30840 [Aquimarina muelleri]
MQKYIYLIIFLYCLSGCNSPQVTFNKRIISNSEYKEQFFVSEKKAKVRSDVFYYWLKSQKIQFTKSGYSGNLLHGKYTKHYQSNQLAEKGGFNNGIKKGIWNSWYKNGQLATTENWKNGKLSGKNIFYDSIGNIVSIGAYKNDKRSGRWLYPQNGDTIYYKRGEKYMKKEKDTTRNSFFSRFFKKKDSISSTTKKTKKTNFFQKLFTKKSSQKKNKKTYENQKPENQQKTTKKPNFFQRLFAKKNKNT